MVIGGGSPSLKLRRTMTGMLNQKINMMKEIIEYREVRRLNILIVGLVWFGVFLIYLILVGILALGGASFIWYTLIGLGIALTIYFLSKSSGLELNYEDRVYRKYESSLLGTKGKWKSLEAFTDVVLLSKKGGKNYFGGIPNRALLGARMEGLGYYELYLMDPSHRRKIFVCNSQSLNSIKKKIAWF